MPRGDKSSYTAAQKRKAEHIEESYEDQGVPPDEAAARAWATVNKQSGGGERSGSGRQQPEAKKTSARRASAKNAAKAGEGQGVHDGNARSASKKPRSSSKKPRSSRNNGASKKGAAKKDAPNQSPSSTKGGRR